MADKSNRSPVDLNNVTNINNKNNNNNNNNYTVLIPSASISSPSSSSVSIESCSCSKIVIMQLFHEMKQDFPTIPDHIVYKYVTNNCHNRSACIEGLRQESKEYPGSVNPYPQALRNQNSKKTMILVRKEALVAKPSASTNEGTSTENLTSERNKENAQALTQQKIIPPQRPNTLNLRSLDSCIRTNHRPTRIAPPPPSTGQSTNGSPSGGENSSGAGSLTPLNVSLNVIVSPVSGRPPVRPPRNNTNASPLETNSDGKDDTNQYHQHYHHHPHNPRPPPVSSPRNIRSVSFTLHQPSGSVPNKQNSSQNEDDSSRPSLKYASSSYDAQTGYQSRLEIIVAGNNGNGGVGDDSNANGNNRLKSNMPVIDKKNEDVQSSSSTNHASRSGGISIPSVVATSEFLEEGNI